MEKWKEVAKSIVETVKLRAKEVWDGNQAARDFVEERAERLAKLTVEYGITVSDSEREALKNQMALVSETIETELLAVALVGQESAKSTFREVVNTVFGAVVKILPVVLSSI